MFCKTTDQVQEITILPCVNVLLNISTIFVQHMCVNTLIFKCEQYGELLNHSTATLHLRSRITLNFKSPVFIVLNILKGSSCSMFYVAI